LSRLLSWCLRAYQYALSPLVGNQCRFAPTCSQYALDAIDRHGALRGLWLALGRLGRCHPWHPGGIDPVPRQFHWFCACGGQARDAREGR